MRKKQTSGALVYISLAKPSADRAEKSGVSSAIAQPLLRRADSQQLGTATDGMFPVYQ